MTKATKIISKILHKASYSTLYVKLIYLYEIFGEEKNKLFTTISFFGAEYYNIAILNNLQV